MPRAFTDREKALIRGRLIAAGRKLLNTDGIKGLTVDELARRARIAKGSFYAFFPSRDDLILSVLESWEEEYRGPLLRSVLSGGGSPREKLVRFFAETVRLVEREPALARLGAGEIRYIAERLPPERLAAHQAADARALTEAFAQWVEAGILRSEDIPALLGAVQLLFLMSLHRDELAPGSFDTAVATIVEALAARFAAGGENEE